MKIFRDEMKISSLFNKNDKMIKMYKNSEKLLENLQKMIERKKKKKITK